MKKNLDWMDQFKPKGENLLHKLHFLWKLLNVILHKRAFLNGRWISSKFFNFTKGGAYTK